MFRFLAVVLVVMCSVSVHAAVGGNTFALVQCKDMLPECKDWNFYPARLNLETSKWSMIGNESLTSVQMGGQAIDPWNHRLYALDPNGGLTTFSTVSGAKLNRVPLKSQLMFIAAHWVTGDVYALISTQTGPSQYGVDVVRVDWRTGAITVVAQTDAGTVSNDMRAIDWKNDVYYFVGGQTAMPDTFLYAVDLKTGIVRSKVTFNPSVGTFAYNPLDSSFIGLCQFSAPSSWEFTMCKIDPTTGKGTPLSAVAAKFPYVSICDKAVDWQQKIYYGPFDSSTSLNVYSLIDGHLMKKVNFTSLAGLDSVAFDPSCV